MHDQLCCVHLSNISVVINVLGQLFAMYLVVFLLCQFSQNNNNNKCNKQALFELYSCNERGHLDFCNMPVDLCSYNMHVQLSLTIDFES